jgi:tetratricopeptide (TPR) repeat protein
MAEKTRYNRYNKKDLKAPDEFISWFSVAVSWLRENAVKAVIAVACVVVVFGAGLGTRTYLSWKEDKATRDLWPHLNRAREFLQAPSRAQADNEKLARLEQFLRAHVRMYPNSRAAAFARYYLGSIAYINGRYDVSAEEFKQALASVKGADNLTGYLVRLGLAQALEAKGDAAGAEAAYKDAAGAATGELRAQALVGEARAMLPLGKKQEAVAIYRQVLAENPGTPLKDLIEIRLQQLG